MIDVLVLLLGIGLIAYGVFKWGTLNDDYFVKRRLQYLKPFFVVGNMYKLFIGKYSMNEYITNMYNNFPTEKLYGFFEFRKPFIFVRDPEIVKQLAVKDFDNFEDHRSFMDENADVMFTKNLFLMKGEKWRDMRATLSPAFTGSKMRQMFELINDCAFDMTTYLKSKSENGEELHTEMKDLFSKYTTDVIATVAFGINVNSFENNKNEFYVTGKKLLNFATIRTALKFTLMSIAPWLAKALNLQLIDESAKNFFKNMVIDTMDIRMKENIYRPDMINILMHVKRGNAVQDDPKESTKDIDGFATVEESSIGKVTVKRKWSDDEIVAQCFLFFAAGFDTSSTVLMFTVYELTRQPEIQEKLYAEIAETNSQLKGKKLPYDDLQKMKYMDKVISEVLRVWPPAPMTDRECVKDYDYNDGNHKFRIEKGIAIVIPIYGFHHDPQYFPNPEKFDPERFSDENKGSIIPGTYLPFGVGPRNCIGSRFALMEVKAVIYYLMLNFKFVPNDKTQIPVKLAKTPMSLKTERGVELQLLPR